jgi:hypothetical protein
VTGLGSGDLQLYRERVEASSKAVPHDESSGPGGVGYLGLTSRLCG